MFNRHSAVIVSILLLLINVNLNAESSDWRNSSSIDFSEAPEIQNQIESDEVWLNEADRLMGELTTLDVRMYTLISRIGSEELRKELIEKRNINRKLIYKLAVARNDVIQRLELNERRFGH
jgi:hypothetical protein